MIIDLNNPAALSMLDLQPVAYGLRNLQTGVALLNLAAETVKADIAFQLATASDETKTTKE